MKSPTLSLENTRRFALALTGIACMSTIILTTLNQFWFAAGLCAVILTVWMIFIPVLERNQQTWSNITFYSLCIALMLSSLYGIALGWLLPILLCVLSGWDLMHLYLRLAQYSDAEVEKGMSPILKQHYQRLGWVALTGVLLVFVVNSVQVKAHFGWNLFWLLVAGGSVSYIVHWIRKRYS